MKKYNQYVTLVLYHFELLFFCVMMIDVCSICYHIRKTIKIE